MQKELKKIVSVYHPNGFVGNEHIHAHHEMVYCLEGEGFVHIRGKKMKFSTGNYYITHAGTPHSEYDNRASRIIYFFFDAAADAIREGTYTDYKGNVSSVIRHLYQEARQELSQKKTMTDLLISQLLIEAERAAGHPPDRQDFSMILQYINETLEQNLDFEQLAMQYNYSYDRFRHIFKARTGTSPHQYVLNQRVEKAKFLLSLNPKNSLTEIAFDCGFTSSSQFSSLFLAKTGMTPTRYIKCMEKERK